MYSTNQVRHKHIMRGPSDDPTYENAIPKTLGHKNHSSKGHTSPHLHTVLFLLAQSQYLPRHLLKSLEEKYNKNSDDVLECV